MYNQNKEKKRMGKRVAVVVAFFLFFFCILEIEHARFQNKDVKRNRDEIEISRHRSIWYCSCIPFLNWQNKFSTIENIGKKQMCGILGYLFGEDSSQVDHQSMDAQEKFLRMTEEKLMQFFVENENAKKASTADESEEIKVPVEKKPEADYEIPNEMEPEQFYEPDTILVKLDPEQWRDVEAFRERFYTIDPTTDVFFQENQIHIFLQKDMDLDLTKEGPKILIYHTHSQEGFADSIPGDSSTTIVGAGDYLAKLLKEKYGISVIHETGEYDITSRSTAYSNIQPVLESYVAKNPSLQVMIDLHRDEVKEGKLVVDMDGKPTARYMFFNGMSYLKELGSIGYLENPYIEDNMAFSFQLQFLSEEYYPGLARKIYLKGYRYNLHYLPKSILIELGAQTNTREEIWNGVDCIAELLAKVLL